MDKLVRTKDLFSKVPPYLQPLFDSFEYPWEMLPHLKKYISELINQGLDGYTHLTDEILIEKNVKIHPSSTIIGPAIIGHGCEVRPGAYIRGSVIIGDECVIGNSTEIKNSILLDGVAAPHYNYIGDCVLGCKAHTGAGVICSNLRSDGGDVTVHADRDYKTGMRKLGAILADGADIGSGCVLNPGTVVGRNTSVYPLTSLRGVYPPDCIVKDTKTVVKRV